MSVDQETIREEILKLLGGKIKRQIKAWDLVEEVSTILEIDGADKKAVWETIRQLKLDEMIHDETYLAIGKPKRGKGFDAAAVEPTKAAILAELEKDDYQSQKTLQATTKASFDTFKAATDALKLEGKIMFKLDPALGWLVALKTERQVTQRPAAKPTPTPSKPGARATVAAVEDPF